MRPLALTTIVLALACAERAPEVVELSVGRVEDLAADPGPHRVRLERGTIDALTPLREGGRGTLRPGTFALWQDDGVPSPEELAELLRSGVTSLVLVDRPLVDSLALRSYVGTARSRGPRLFVSGPELRGSLGEDATPLRYRGRVQDYIAFGAELVVIDAAAGREVVCAVVEEAERQGGVVWLRARSKDALSRTVDCRPRAIWLDAAIAEPWELTPPTESVWILPPELDSPAGVRPVARFGAEATRGFNERYRNPARTLNVEDAVARVAPGYVADLVVEEGAERRVYLEGVLQQPSEAWLSGLFVWWATVEIERRIPDDF